MKIYNLIIYSILIINVGTSQSLNNWNLDFEEWDTTVNYQNEIFDDIIQDREPMQPLHWFCNANNLSACNGYSQTTDSDHGEYAFVLSGFYQYEFMSITLGDLQTSGLPISYKPQNLKGSYKAILLGTTCDSLRAYADLYLTKYNSTEQSRDTIGEGHIILEETDDTYQNFVVDIDYSDNMMDPDSVSITLSKRRFGFPLNINECYECGHVFFDNLSLPAMPLSTNENEGSVNEFECYPNPASDQFTIKNNSSKSKFIHVFDAMGSIQFKGYIKDHSEIILQTKQSNSSILFISDGRTTKKILVTN